MVGRQAFECNDWITTIDDEWEEIHVYHKRPDVLSNKYKHLCCTVGSLKYYLNGAYTWKNDLSSETFSFLERLNRLQVMR